VLALNIATPFFTVFLLKSMHMPLSYIIALNVLSQLSSIVTIRGWGRFADIYSNKTILAIAAPLYVLCIIAWCFVGIYTHFYANMALLAVIFIVSGTSLAGINLALTNIGMKLAPREEAVVYLSVKNIITSSFSFAAPLIGGYLADYFTRRHLYLRAEWGGPHLTKVFRLIELHEWNFLFAIAAVLAFVAIEFLVPIKEVGEVEKDEVVRVMRSSLKNNLKEAFVLGQLITWQEQLWGFLKRKRSDENKDTKE
jgi:MFS family permease